MGTFLQQYGVDDERRNRVIKTIIFSVLGILVLGIAAYLIFKDYPEKQKAKQFLEQVNARNYQGAYQEWGCTAQHPCPNYDYNRFLEDWAPKSKGSAQWTIASTDSCRSFLTVNVQAPGAELQSLSVQRRDLSLGYAPGPECNEPKWRWKQFFQSWFGETPAPPHPTPR